MNTPILIPVDEIIHTFEHPYCGNAACLCNEPLRDANAEAVAHIMTIERGMSLQEARQTLRITTQDLGDDYAATYDSETLSLQLVRASSKTRMILTLDTCYHLYDLLKAMLPHRENEEARWQAESEAH
jgi:hypothetical protein